MTNIAIYTALVLGVFLLLIVLINHSENRELEAIDLDEIEKTAVEEAIEIAEE